MIAVMKKGGGGEEKYTEPAIEMNEQARENYIPSRRSEETILNNSLFLLFRRAGTTTISRGKISGTISVAIKAKMSFSSRRLQMSDYGFFTMLCLARFRALLRYL